MNLSVLDAQLSQIRTEALILAVREDETPQGLLAEIDRACQGAIATALRSRTFKGKAEQVETLYPVAGLDAGRVVLVGLGKEALSAEDWRTAVSAGLDAVSGKASAVTLLLPDHLPAAMAAEAAAEAGLLSLYAFHPYQAPDPEAITVTELALLSASPAEAGPAAERGAAMARAVMWVRDMANKPGNMMRTPQLVEEAVGLAKTHAITARVVDEAGLAREGFGLIEAVGRGSEDPAAFVVLEYRGGAEDEAPVALVGKGVTFDTGGICIKPRAGMEEMKTDMHGAATVMGVLRMAAERKLPVNLVGLLCIAENATAGDAFKPGDILKAYNGLTVEIGDTDAEGRLVMADGIAYAVRHHAPKAVIDIATLTGSIIMALGYEASGLFCDDALAKGLVAAGEETGERLWRFPTWDAYAEKIKSSIADLRNVGIERGDAINAAMFLRAFAGGVPWAHLDIAGPSWLSEPRPYRPKGSTGVGVRMLTRWLEDGAPLA